MSADGVSISADRDDLRRRCGEVLDLPWVKCLSDPRGRDIREILTGDSRGLVMPYAPQRLGLIDGGAA